MARLGLAPHTVIGARQTKYAFDVWLRDNGLGARDPTSPTKRSARPITSTCAR
jgi:hypothetical protein